MVTQVKDGLAPQGAHGASIRHVHGLDKARHQAVINVFNRESAVQLVPKVDSVTVSCGEAPAPEPTALPPTGTGPLSTDQGGSSMVIWLAFGTLLIVGAM